MERMNQRITVGIKVANNKLTGAYIRTYKFTIDELEPIAPSPPPPPNENSE